MSTLAAPQTASRRNWRRFFRLRLRTLLVLMALAALAFNWVRLADRQRELVQAIEEISGDQPTIGARYDWQVDEKGEPTRAELSWWERWLENEWRQGWFDQNFFHSVVMLEIVSPAKQLPLAAQFPRLRWLHINGEPTDDSLASLRDLPRLRGLSLDFDTGDSATVELSDKGLAHLAGLTNLETLRIVIPPGGSQKSIDTLAGLRELRYLYLQVAPGARIETGFASLANLSRLRRLVVVAEGEVNFAGIDALAGLEELQIARGDQLTDEQLIQLGKRAPLKRVVLEDCSRVSLTAFAGMPQLETLTISSEALRSSQLQALASLPQLGSLVARAGSGIANAEFYFDFESDPATTRRTAKSRFSGSFPNLRSLRLNCFDQVSLGDFRGMQQLEELDLESCREFIDNDPSCAVRLDNLKSLSLQNITVGVAKLDGAWFRTWHNVQELFLQDYVPDMVFENLRSLPRLRRLELIRSKKNVDELLRHVGRVTSLRELSISHAEQFSGRGLALLCDLPKLEKMELDACIGLNAAGLANVNRLTHLQQLNIVNHEDAICDQLSAVPELISLSVVGRPFTDGEIALLASHPKLQRLELTNLAGATDAGLAQLSNCRSLVSLKISDCSSISGGGFLALKKLARLEELEIVDAAPTSVASPEVAQLRQALPRCRIEFFESSGFGCCLVIPQP